MAEQGGTPGNAGEKAEDAAPKHINLKVKDQQESEVTFKLKSTSPMEKLMKAYAGQQDKTLDSLRFMFDGHRILKHDTAASLGMEDGYCIDVFQEQLGGGELS
jgi:small ubiquitin-related modifier